MARNAWARRYRAFAHPCMGLSKSSGFSVVRFFLVPCLVGQFLGSTTGPFLRPDHGFGSRRAQPSSRLAAGHRRRRREAALTAASTARSCFGRAVPSGSSLPIGSEGSSPAAAEPSVPQQPCIRYDPFGVGDHDAVMRIDGEAPKGGPILQKRHKGRGWARDTATSDRHRQRLARKRTRAE